MSSTIDASSLRGEDAISPWTGDHASYPDVVKRLVYRYLENERAARLPHVVPQLPKQPTVQGMDSPHQAGDHISYDMLTRLPHYVLTSHFTSIAAGSPVRGEHRHLSAPTLFCEDGKGWERNDGIHYDFEKYDLLVVPPYTSHQHGGDPDVSCEIYVPETGRVHHILGLVWREQMKLSEKPNFPDGTSPLYEDGKLVGYRIKKGVLGLTEDLDVKLGSEPERAAVFEARKGAKPLFDKPANTYDRYVQLLQDEVEFSHRTDHVVRFNEQQWELTPQGKMLWLVHPQTATAANGRFIYIQEIPSRSRSGRHRHVAEELILVLRGSGYDIHDGERWDWKEGDLIAVPTMTEHQHFSTSDEPVLLLSATPSHYYSVGLGGIEQLENAPEYDDPELQEAAR